MREQNSLTILEWNLSDWINKVKCLRNNIIGSSCVEESLICVYIYIYNLAVWFLSVDFLINQSYSLVGWMSVYVYTFTIFRLVFTLYQIQLLLDLLYIQYTQTDSHSHRHTHACTHIHTKEFIVVFYFSVPNHLFM